MRITNDAYTPIELVAELIANTRSITNEDTKNFFSNEKSSHDWLVTAVANKLDVILESFKRYGTQVSETQCIRDNGVDVRLTFERQDKSEYRVGFQIKSNREAIEDAKNQRPKGAATMIATLKRQAFEAEQNSRIDEWWILSCFDLTCHSRLVSTINTEIGIGKPNGMRIRNVTPREVMALLSYDDEDIDAICTLLLCKDDEVLKMAREEVIRMGPISRGIVMSSLGNALEGDRFLSQSDVENLAGDYDSIDNFASEINELESLGYLNYESDGFLVNPTAYVGLCALYFEARARHGYRASTAMSFVSRMTANLND